MKKSVLFFVPAALFGMIVAGCFNKAKKSDDTSTTSQTTSTTSQGGNTSGGGNTGSGDDSGMDQN